MNDEDKSREQLIQELNELRQQIQQQSRHFSFVENVGVVFYIADINGFCTYANPAAKEMTGYSHDEIIGMHFSQLVAPDWQERVTTFYLKQFQDKAHTTLYEFPMMTRSGEEKWVEQSVSLVFDETNEHITGLQCIVHDISERKHIQAALEENETRYRQITDAMSDFAFIFDFSPEGENISNWITGTSFEKLTGYSPEIFVAPGDFYHPDDRKRALADIQRTLTGDETPGEYRIIIKSGETRWISVHRHAVWDETRTYVQQIYGAAHDITERKQAESALRDNEARYRIITESMSDYAFAFEFSPEGESIEGWITEEPFQRLTGYHPDELDTINLIYHPDDRERAVHDIENCIAGNAVDGEYRIVTKSGEIRWIVVRRKVEWDETKTYVKRNYGAAQDITERKQAESALRDNEMRYRLITESMSDYAFIFDLSSDGNPSNIWITEISFQRLTGYHPDELESINAIYHPDDREQALRDIASCIQGQVVNGEYRIITKSGEMRWLRVQRQIDWDETHSYVQRIYGTTQDITERKQAEDALRENEAKLRHNNELLELAIDSINGALWIEELIPDKRFDEQPGTTSLSPGEKKLLGYDEDDETVTYATWDRHVLEEDRAQRNKNQRDHFEGRTPLLDHEYRVRRKDGEIIWVHGRGKIIRNEQGQPILWVGIDWDITERKRVRQAEAEQRSLAETLREIAVIINSTLDFDEALERILVNVERVTPYDTANIMLIDNGIARIERTVGYDKRGIDEEDLKKVQFFEIVRKPHYRLMYETGEPHIISNTLEYDSWAGGKYADWIRSHVGIPIRSGDETIGFLNLDSATPNFYTPAHIPALTALANQIATAIRNVTLFKQAENIAIVLADANHTLQTEIEERKQTEIALLQAKEDAEAANRSKSIFLSNMSHELRTPLNAILGFSQILVTEPDIDPKHRHYIETIMGSGEHLLGIINDILEISRIEAGRTKLNPVDFDLYQMLTSLQKMFTLQAAEKELRLAFDIAQDVPQYIHADSGKLQQILVNLLRNAIKFTESGQISLRIRLNHDDSTEHIVYLRFEVEDTGIGIAADELDQLFHPFWQARSANYKAGTGLGLAIVHQFVEHLGGEINVKSEPGKGTIFSFDIHTQALDAPMEVTTRKLDIVGLKEGQTSHRILVVDDEPINREVLIALMERFGFEVREAQDGEEAVEIYQKWHPDLIWMDMRMPIMDGYEATRQIKADPAVKNTKIVAITAAAFKTERKAILDTGCDDYIAKPFHHQDIYRILQTHLGLEIIYKDDSAIPTTELAAANEQTQLPATLIDQLAQTALLADVQRMRGVIEIVNQHDPELAKRLSVWTQEFRFGKILDLIEFMQKTSST